MRIPWPRLIYGAFAPFVVLLLGCGAKGHVHVPDSELPGTYAAQFEHGKEQLILRADKTYEQVFSSPERQFINRGTWISKYVLFEGTDVELLAANCSEDNATVGNCRRNLNVHRDSKKLSLALSEAADWYYQRID
jgi:hypothetical protein